MCGSNLIILSLPLSRRGWREIERETERERVAIHVAIGFVMLWFLSFSLSHSLARSLRTPFYPPPPLLSHSFSISLSHTHTRQTLSLSSSSSLSLSVCLSLPQLHSLLCCKFICCVKQQLAREWAVGFDPFVKRPPASVYRIHLRTTGLAAWLSLTSLVPSWVYHDRASHLAEMGSTMRCWRFDGVSRIHMWTSVQFFFFSFFSNILIVVSIVCVIVFCWCGPPHLLMLVSSVSWNYHIHGLHSIKSQSVKGPARSVFFFSFSVGWNSADCLWRKGGVERGWEYRYVLIFFVSKLFHS